MKRPISKSEEYEKYFQRLGTQEDKLFLTMKDVMMVALLVGYERGVRKPFDKSGGDPIKEHLFSADDKNIMDIIALNEKNDITILLDDHEAEKVKIIEEYINGGMETIVEEICMPVPTMDKLVNFVVSYQQEKKHKKGIDELLNEVAKDV